MFKMMKSKLIFTILIVLASVNTESIVFAQKNTVQRDSLETIS
jgi:hypothetical protein